MDPCTDHKGRCMGTGRDKPLRDVYRESFCPATLPTRPQYTRNKWFLSSAVPEVAGQSHLSF